jgi:hypothetical protein
MSSIMIHDLHHSQELDRRAMSSVHGGTSLTPGGFGPFANVNVNINQNIEQYQNVQVAALNNIGIIGAGFVAPSFDVSPKQIGKLNAAVF